MRTVVSLLMFGLIATALPRHAKAQRVGATPTGVVLTAADTAPREADDGSALTLLFRLRNASTATLSVEGAPTLPESWRVLVGPAPIAVEPGRTAFRLVTILVPAGALAGRYAVRYDAWAAGGRAAQATTSVTVVVRERSRLGLELLDAPHFVVAGERYVVAGLVRNLGNTPVTAGVGAHGSSGLRARVDSPLVHLDVGEARQVSFSVDTRGLVSRESHQNLWFATARIGKGGVDSTVAAHASSEVEIAPRARMGQSRYHVVPLTLAVRRTSQLDAGSSLGHDDAIEVSGGGMLREGGATRVDVFAHYSRATGQGPAARNEFSLAFSGPVVDLRVGDYAFGFSPLTETARVATGAAVRARLGRWSAGAFVVRDAGRYGVPLKAEAATIGYRVAPGLQLSANGIVRHDSGAPMVGSLRAAVRTPALGSLDVEAGLSRSPGARSGFAWSVGAHGAPFGFVYDARRLQGDRSYVGPFQGLRQDNLSLSTPVLIGLRLSGQISSQIVGRDVLRANPDSLPGTTLSSQRSDGSSFGLTWGDHLAVTQRTVRQEASYEGQILSGKESTIEARASARLGRALGVSGEVSRGRQWSGATAVEQQFWRYVFRGQLSIGSAQSFGVSVERQLTAASAAAPAVARLNMSASGNVRLPTGTSLSLQASVTRGPGYSLGSAVTPASFATSLYDAALTQRLPFGHLATVRVRSVTARFLPSGGQRFLQVEYRVPVGLPAAGSKMAGRVVVLVRDAESGHGVANVVVRLDGRPVLTDGSGQAEFRGLSTKTYYLQVERASLGAGRAADRAQQIPLVVSGDRTERVSISVLRAARVIGSVRRWDFAERRQLADTAGTELVESGGMERIAVELDNGTEVWRQVTGPDGAFAFHGVFPGRWTVRVVDAALPDLHHLEADSIVVDLRTGGAPEVIFRVLPQRPTIHFVPPPSASPQRGGRAARGQRS